VSGYLVAPVSREGHETVTRPGESGASPELESRRGGRGAPGPAEGIEMNSKWISVVALAAALAVIQGCAGTKGDTGPAGVGGTTGASGTNGTNGADLTRTPRHVILIIGDGMQLAHEVASSRYLTGTDYGLVFHDPVRFDWSGYAATWDVTTYNQLRKLAPGGVRPAFADSSFDPAIGYDVTLGGLQPYPRVTADPTFSVAAMDAYFLATVDTRNPPATDSASAGTALATGFKTENGRIAWRPGAGGALTTIAEDVRARYGAAIGVVSTVPFTHATPATFVSHNLSRGNYAAIGAEIIRTVKPDVVIGGGWPFDPSHASTNYKYIARAEYDALYAGSTDYVLVERVPGQPGGSRLLAAAASLPAGKKLFGLFGMKTSANDGNFESPIATGDPSNVVSLATRENPTLAQATEAALTVLSRNQNGFFVMIEQGDIDWANHAGDLKRTFGTVWDLDLAVSSAIAFVDRPGDDVTWENTLLVVTSDHGNDYLRFGGGAALGKGVLPATDPVTGVPTDPAQYVLAPGYTSWEHTNELVSVYAKGASSRLLFGARTGTWYPGAHVVDNTQIHDAMAEFLGLR
jgi:alkaline phosphatase